MIYHGRIRNGVIVLDEAVRLPEGVKVRVGIIDGQSAGGTAPAGTVWDDLLELAGSAAGLPSDLARQHDHYLYGTPKR